MIDPAELRRLAQECAEDDERMTRVPWHADEVAGIVFGDGNHDDGSIEVARMQGEALIADSDAIARTRNNLSAIASALTDAAELASKYADAKAIADLFCEEQTTLTAERDAARAEVERLRAGIREALDRGSSFARDHSLRAALRKLVEVAK